MPNPSLSCEDEAPPDYTAMVRMRNRLAHEYDETISAWVWSTVVRCQTHHSTDHLEVRRHYDLRYDAQQRWIAALQDRR